jgi:hypothetical protein
MNQTGQPYLGRMIINDIIDGNDITFWMDALRNSLLSDPQYHGYIRGTFTGDG